MQTLKRTKGSGVKALLRLLKVRPHIGGEGARAQLFVAALAAARQAAASNASRLPAAVYGSHAMARG